MDDLFETIFDNMFSEEDLAVYLEARINDPAYSSLANYAQSSPDLQSILNEMDKIDNNGIMENLYTNVFPEYDPTTTEPHKWIIEQTSEGSLLPIQVTPNDYPTEFYETHDNSTPDTNNDIEFDDNPDFLDDMGNL